MKRLLLLILLAPLTISLHAQFKIGPSFGYNQSTTTMSRSGVTVSEVYGFNYGISMMIGSDISFQPEILYVQKGMRIDSVKNDDYFEITANYLEVPLLLNFSFGGERVRFFFNFGPYIGYWMSGQVKSELNGVSITQNYVFDEDLEDDGFRDHRFDYGFIGGAGVKLKTWKGFLLLSGRMDYGFDDISTVAEGGPQYVSIRNRTLGVSLTYLFQL
ncbi:MAG: porin family protein [Bacteroidota bacterium]|nr:porin family protein [Bacteroidota bacterium]